jgi:hypothetical protein
VAVLVVGDSIRDAAGLLTAGGRPWLGQRQLIGHRLACVLVAPLPDAIGQERDPRTEDVGQPGSLQRDLIALGDHPGISDHRYVGQIVSGLERVDHRQHRGSLGLIALEGLHPHREARGVGEQPDRDLRVAAGRPFGCRRVVVGRFVLGRFLVVWFEAVGFEASSRGTTGAQSFDEAGRGESLTPVFKHVRKARHVCSRRGVRVPNGRQALPDAN